MSFKFEEKQKVFDIAGIKVGGQLGEYPTVLIGSIFYDGHRIVKNAAKGEFDKNQARSLIKKHEELSDKTGNPFILDVVGATAEALIKYVDFVSATTNAPFLIDSSSAAVRIPVIKYVAEVGLRDRGIYNSIDHAVKPEEMSAIKDFSIKSSVVLAYNPENQWPEGRLEILGNDKAGLLKVAKDAGIENILIDTAVLDVPSIGLANKSIYLVKNRYGLPTGCSPANAVATWKRVKREYGPYGFQVCNVGACITTLMAGANFVLYGPVEYAEATFSACAMTDAIIAYNAKREGIKPKVPNHPLYKIF